MPLDPKVKAYLQQMEELNAPPIMEQTLQQARDAMIANTEGLGPEEPVERIVDIPIVDSSAMCMARLYIPYEPEDGMLYSAMLYFHGGGWVTGNIATHDRLCRAIAVRSQSLVMSVDYRLAPEHPFPAAVQDACASYRYLVSNASRYGADPGRISVAGDSAGGNLAAAVALAAKKNRWSQPATQILIYPVLDCDFENGSYMQFAQGYGLTRAAMRWFWDQYAPDSQQRTQPYASPLREKDLAALPPALIITAEYDPLRDEGEAYAEKLRQQNVPVQLIRYDGQIHGFVRRRETFDQADEAIALIAKTVDLAALAKR